MKTPTFFFALFIFIPLVLFAQSNTLNIDQITEKIKGKEKHSMVFFHMERCPYCKKLLKNALSDEEVKKKIVKDYILIDVNVDKAQIIQYKDFTGNAKEFCKHLSIGYYPTVVFIDDNNEIVYSMKGYRKTATFNHILDYVTKKIYLETDFGGYLFDIDEVE